MRKAAFALATALVVVATDARAYTYQSLVSKGCHERIAMTALRTMRSRLPALVSVQPDADDTAFIHDLPFDLDPEFRDLTGASLAVGVRDNDLRGRGPDELDSLAQVHGNPNEQMWHCLRGPLEDEPNGTVQAIEDCKEFIRQHVSAALDALGPDGYPDNTKRTPIEVTLMFRHQVTANLPQFWIEMGHAMHALEDSFTHEFRSSDHLRIHVTENYTDYVNGSIVESRDGPTHRAQMDECEGLDAYREKNLEYAATASIELLQLALGPATRDAKMAALETTMSTYLTYEPGCTYANHWCGAPENNYSVSPGCSVGGRRAADSFLFAAGLMMAGLGLAARRRRGAAVAAVAGVLFFAGPAEAQETQETAPVAGAGTPQAAATTQTAPVATPETAPDVSPSKAPPGVLTKSEVKAEQKNEEHFSRWAIFAALSGSISNPSANGQLGGRYSISERWQVGLDGEINGWYGSITHHLAAGTFNGYATVVFRTPLRFAPINLRATGNVGFSTLLIDLYGAPAGSTGVFLGLSPLGVEWKIASRVFLIISGISIALPIPKLTGAPFAYSQYRESIGVEISL